MRPMAEARTPCPMCGQPIHPIAGRCKHCKANLAAMRAHKAPAVAALPVLVRPVAPTAPIPPAAPIAPTVAPAAPPVSAYAPPTPGDPPPRHAPRGVTARAAEPLVLPDSPPLKPTWPIAVIVIAVAAVVVSVIVVAWNRSRKPAHSSYVDEADESDTDELEKFGKEQERLAEERERAKALAKRDDVVRPPVAADLADYTAHLAGDGTLKAKIDTPLGTINCELFADRTPMTVANFVGLATGKKPWLDRDGQIQKARPFYDGLTFHRVIEDFMIQGGDPNGTGTGGPGYQFANEIDHRLTMEEGSLAMANSGPDTNGSQFFITEKATEWLDGKHTIFGKCSDLNVVRRIARVPRSSSDQPFDAITMTITISRDQ
jgi:peptidyl-prolyl cis-trans isomerase A (cyclophilin A)